MKLLLLILTLMSGHDAEGDRDVEACEHGWVQFTCKYPETNRKHDHINVFLPNRTTLRSSLKDVWEDKGRFSLYHDTKSNTVKVGIRDLERRDFGKYRCGLDQSSNRSPVKKLESERCRRPFTQTVTRTAQISITCVYPDDDFKSGVKFFCKGENFTCEDILSTKGSTLNGTFRLTTTDKGFIVSISDVSSQDAGVYWCGVKSNDGSYRVSIRQIKLEVEVGSHLTAIILVALLLLVVIVVFTFKCFSWSKYRKNEKAQNKEDHIYEAIQESSQKSNTMPAMKTIYVTANFPTNPSVFMHESKVSVKSISGEASYLNLWKPDQCDTKSMAHHPSRVSSDPFYSLSLPCTEEG